jgi:uncharacterized membrane protein YbjE (DUF340 family)
MSANTDEMRLGIVKLSMWLGYLVMIGMGLALAVFEWSDGNATLAIIFCVVIFTANFFGFLGMEKGAKDERARKIGTYAATYSWYITLVAMCFLFIWDIAFGMHMSVARFFGIVLLVMVVSMMLINAYKGYKGDVE